MFIPYNLWTKNQFKPKRGCAIIYSVSDGAEEDEATDPTQNFAMPCFIYES